MKHRIRYTIEIDDNPPIEREVIVDRFDLNQENGIREVPSSGPFIEREFDGNHTLTLRYHEVAA